MAKNYTFAEAVKIIDAGTDMESIIDIGRRYPALLHKVTVVTAKAGEAFVDLMNYMPDYLTANKVNTVMKNAIGGSTEAEDADDETDADKTAENEATETEVADAPTWNDSMSAKQLWDVLGKAGKRKLAKSTKKADLIEACKQAFGVTAEADEVEDEVEADEAAEANPYEGKSAMELFKECKKRGIKAAAKKPAKFYADLLAKADAETAKAAEETDSESDDWDEDEADEAPAKKETKKADKADKKVEKTTSKEEADDDDDWDI